MLPVRRAVLDEAVEAQYRLLPAFVRRAGLGLVAVTHFQLHVELAAGTRHPALGPVGDSIYDVRRQICCLRLRVLELLSTQSKNVNRFDYLV